MQYFFLINNIKCGSCVNSITSLLSERIEATNIVFDNLNTQISFITDQEVNTNSLNQLLKEIGDYLVSDKILLESSITYKSISQSVSYKPIYLIFSYLIGINILISLIKFNLDTFMMNFMASFFIVFSFFKILDLKGFADGFSSYDIVARRFYIYGYIYPFIELCFGIAYLLCGQDLYLNMAVFFVMLIASIGVIKAKLMKQQFYCACVGTFLKVPLGSIAIIEYITMVVMSLIMIFIIIG